MNDTRYQESEEVSEAGSGSGEEEESEEEVEGEEEAEGEGEEPTEGAERMYTTFLSMN